MKDSAHITMAIIAIAAIAAASLVPDRAEMAATVALVAACHYLFLLSQ
jgi:hypothetical protein